MRAFLENHMKDLVALDFFVVPTATFRRPVRPRRSGTSAPSTGTGGSARGCPRPFGPRYFLLKILAHNVGRLVTEERLRAVSIAVAGF
jgi:hypothetical protein